MEDTRVHALDYLKVFQRRKWWLAGPILASILVGALLVRLLPKEYRSSATLAGAAPIVSPNLVNESSPLGNQEVLSALSPQHVSAAMLTRVVREEGTSDGTGERQIAQLRRAIAVSV